MRTILRNTRRGWMTFNEADKGGSSGSAPAQPGTKVEQTPVDGAPEGKPAEEEKEPALEGETLESKVDSAKGIISSLWTRLTAALNNGARLQSQFDSLTTAANDAKAESTRLTGELSTMTQSRDAEKIRADRAEKSVVNLEALCGLKGLDPAQAAKPAQAPGSGSNQSLADEYTQLLADEKSGAAALGTAHAFYRKHKAKLDSLGK